MAAFTISDYRPACVVITKLIVSITKFLNLIGS